MVQLSAGTPPTTSLTGAELPNSAAGVYAQISQTNGDHRAATTCEMSPFVSDMWHARTEYLGSRSTTAGRAWS